MKLFVSTTIAVLLAQPPFGQPPYGTAPKDMGGSQRDNDSSPNLLFNDLKQKEIELKEGSARVLWYETQLLIGQPNGGRPKFQGGSLKLIFSQNYLLVYCSLSRVLRF